MKTRKGAPPRTALLPHTRNPTRSTRPSPIVPPLSTRSQALIKRLRHWRVRCWARYGATSPPKTACLVASSARQQQTSPFRERGTQPSTSSASHRWY
eukprot:422645-Prymnesium_polylepis.1